MSEDGKTEKSKSNLDTSSKWASLVNLPIVLFLGISMFNSVRDHETRITVIEAITLEKALEPVKTDISKLDSQVDRLSEKVNEVVQQLAILIAENEKGPRYTRDNATTRNKHVDSELADLKQQIREILQQGQKQ